MDPMGFLEVYSEKYGCFIENIQKEHDDILAFMISKRLDQKHNFNLRLRQLTSKTCDLKIFEYDNSD
eukprot:403355751